MNIRKANRRDLDSIENIYNEIHTAEEEGILTIGWKRDVYPTKKTAEESILRGDMFVLEDGEIGIVPTIFNGIPGVDLVLLEKNLK